MSSRKLFVIGLLALALVVSACAPAPAAAPTPEKITVKETVVVPGTPQVKEVVKEVVITPTAAPKDAPGSVKLNASGATFPQPLYEDWAFAFNQLDPSVVINYAGGGSGQGIKDIKAGTVDFAGTDALLSDALMLHIRKLAGEIGPRPAGHPAEMRARQYIRQVLSALDYDEVETLPFLTPDTWGYALGNPLVLTLASNLLGTRSRVGRLLGGAMALASAYALCGAAPTVQPKGRRQATRLAAADSDLVRHHLVASFHPQSGLSRRKSKRGARSGRDSGGGRAGRVGIVCRHANRQGTGRNPMGSVAGRAAAGADTGGDRAHQLPALFCGLLSFVPIVLAK